MPWKPTAAEKRAIRAYAANAARRRVGQVIIEIASRVSELDQRTVSRNLLLVGGSKSDPLINSDLHDRWPWSILRYGLELTELGEGIFDFYVYEREYIGQGNVRGDLQTNVQAYVCNDNGPRLTKLGEQGLNLQDVFL